MKQVPPDEVEAQLGYHRVETAPVDWREPARKSDSGKLRYSLIPTEPMREVAKVYTLGAKKYDAHNWRKGIEFSRCLDAIERHLATFKDGRDVDPDDGQHPLASVVFYALAMMEYQRTRPEMDDRVKEEK